MARFVDLNSDDNQQSDNIWNALTNPEMRNSSWVCILISLFNNLSGQGLICTFSTAIFERVISMGIRSRFDIKMENNMIGYAAVIGAILSYYTI